MQSRRRACENGNSCLGCGVVRVGAVGQGRGVGGWGRGEGGPGGRGALKSPLRHPQEFKTCNPDGCPEVRRNTPWTPWLPVNVTQGGARQEQRFRFTCRAPLADPHGLQFGRRRTETRSCPANGSGACDTDGTPPPGAPLLPPSQPRRGEGGGGRPGPGSGWPGAQSLRLSPSAALVEDLLRSGSTSPHTVSGGWAAWGPWSSCSRDCELGFRVRKRTCTNPEPRNGGLPCVGDAAEYQDCNPQACPGNPARKESLAQGNPVILEAPLPRPRPTQEPPCVGDSFSLTSLC